MGTIPAPISQEDLDADDFKLSGLPAETLGQISFNQANELQNVKPALTASTGAAAKI